MSADMVGSDAHKAEIKELISEKIGKDVEIDVRHVEEGHRFEDQFVDIESLIHMDITVEDE